MRIFNLLPLIALSCAACSQGNEGAAASGPTEYATQTQAPTPDYKALMAEPRLGDGSWVRRDGSPPLPSNAMEIGQAWYDRLEARNALLGAGFGGKGPDGPVNMLDTGMTEAEFLAWVDDNDWTIPQHITFSFVPPMNLPAVSDAADGGIRIWPASTARTGAQNEALLSGRVELRDGCFYGSEGFGTPDKLAFFHGEIGLDIDDEGYYILRDRVSGHVRARLGEDMHWGGPPSAYIDPELEKEIQEQCGPGEILVVGSPESRERFYAQYPHTRDPNVLPSPPSE
ncbi:hypothetical protein [Altererythrobacter sp. MF3-039]|uniref:hypothetical protein n=1 Tax=Altererythrobacter sp. MF3-039 TaxID=3252901 RepID=UPI00390C884F